MSGAFRAVWGCLGRTGRVSGVSSGTLPCRRWDDYSKGVFPKTRNVLTQRDSLGDAWLEAAMAGDKGLDVALGDTHGLAEMMRSQLFAVDRTAYRARRNRKKLCHLREGEELR